jgi:exodeoxyribonuclease V alpha subunit
MIHKMLTSRGDYLLKKYSSLLQPVDIFTARYLGSKSKVEPEIVFDLVIILCVALRANKVSLSRMDFEGKTLPEVLEGMYPGLLERTEPNTNQKSATIEPDLAGLLPSTASKTPKFCEIEIDRLLKSGLVCVMDMAVEPKSLSEVDSPVILHGHWVYFRRQWLSEWYILNAICSRLSKKILIDESPFSSKIGEMLFDESGKTAGQIQAALNANRYPFSIITGGPGTGKTRTIVGFLASLQHFHPDLRVMLCAPTGKAASRMIESVQRAIESDSRFEEFGTMISHRASTIHRLLGWNPSTGTFKHDEINPIPADLIIVDEASMIDLVMFSRLLRAVSADCRIVLLGDKDQLASVEAGSVFGDLIRAGLSGQNPGLSSVITKLTHSWRFSSESGLGMLADSLNNGDFEHSWSLVLSGSGSISQISANFRDTLLERIKQEYDEILRVCKIDDTSTSRGLICQSAEQALKKLGEFQVLTAHRTGQYGAVYLNRIIDQQLATTSMNGWYAGRPVIATENDYDNGVFNGDLGITVQIGGEFWVYFGADDSMQSVKMYKTSQLGQMESAWALTVHKSQGSEYSEIILILPDYESPVLSRELLYTAVTRAKETVRVIAQKQIWKYAVETTLYKEAGFLNRLILD